MEFEAAKRYIAKKGIGYFINTPSKEDIKALTGIIFDKSGLLMLNKLYIMAGIL